MFIYFLRGSLPWQGVKGASTPVDRFKRIAQCKVKIPIDQLCAGLPGELHRIHSPLTVISRRNKNKLEMRGKAHRDSTIRELLAPPVVNMVK